jgi:hypothetical protein
MRAGTLARTGSAVGMAHHRTKVLVAYHHAILGEGLARMLGEDRSLQVVMADLMSAPELEAALGSTPDVIVLEAGGPLTPDQLMARTSCPTIIDVDLDSTESHAFRRETFPARPADLVARIAAFTGRRDRHRQGAARADGTDGGDATDPAVAAPVAVPIVSDDADATRPRDGPRRHAPAAPRVG